MGLCFEQRAVDNTLCAAVLSDPVRVEEFEIDEVVRVYKLVNSLDGANLRWRLEVQSLQVDHAQGVRGKRIDIESRYDVERVWCREAGEPWVVVAIAVVVKARLLVVVLAGAPQGSACLAVVDHVRRSERVVLGRPCQSSRRVAQIGDAPDVIAMTVVDSSGGAARSSVLGDLHYRRQAQRIDDVLARPGFGPLAKEVVAVPEEPRTDALVLLCNPPSEGIVLVGGHPAI